MSIKRKRNKTKITKKENNLMSNRKIYDAKLRFSWMAHDLASRYGLLCRVFMSDDPKAELAKIIVDDLSVFLSPSHDGTEDAFYAYGKKASDKYDEVTHRYLSDIRAFLATIQDPTKNRID